MNLLRLLGLLRMMRPSVETDHPASSAFLQRFVGFDRRLRALEAFMTSINSTSAGNGGNLTTSSTTYVGTSGATTASAEVGLSGNMLVIGFAQMNIGTGATGSMGLLQGSTLLIDPFSYVLNNTGGTMGLGNSAVNLVSGLTPYTQVSFTLKFKTSAAGVALTVGDPTIVVFPV